VRDDSEALAEYAHSLKAGARVPGDIGFDMDPLIAAKGFDKQRQILLTR
jgi:type I restriction enzyme R subunit